MSPSDTIPVWCNPIELESWPVIPIEDADLRYVVPVPEKWAENTSLNETLMETEHIFRGRHQAEWLIISHMAQADAESDMTNWVNAIQSMTGFPVVHMIAGQTTPPQLVEWQYEGPSTELAERLAVDETHLYQGMARLPGAPVELMHLYIMMARRGNLAWKITLSFSSACPPGTPADVIYNNDHIRAGATFGAVDFTA